MDFGKKIRQIKEKLKDFGIDGWLLFDYHGSNRFAASLLEIPSDVFLTRRFFYWIPQVGDPEKIVHKIEERHLDFLPGKTHLYISWVELEAELTKLLKPMKKVAMEYSPKCAIPSISVVDAGTFEMVQKKGVEVVSSADLLLHFTGSLNERQIELHQQAAEVIKTTLERTWAHIGDSVKKGKIITDYDVQQFILNEFKQASCVTEDPPICAINEYSASPHYSPSKENPHPIKEGDFVLIDLWCKKNIPHAIYADFTRVGVVASAPTPKQVEIFEIVKNAQKKALELIQSRFKKGENLRGAEVDDACRKFIEEKGYGSFFTHRTGHNIDTHVHGGGANLDNFETQDERLLLSGICFSVEPAIYLPNEFGLRLECDVLIHQNGIVEISGGVQENIVCLL